MTNLQTEMKVVENDCQMIEDSTQKKCQIDLLSLLFVNSQELSDDEESSEEEAVLEIEEEEQLEEEECDSY